MSFAHHPSPRSLVGLGLLSLATLAHAGPKVGTVLGTPSSTTSTVDARVVSATPVVAQVAVPKQICYNELREEPARSGGAGAVLGAIAGAAVGNAVGKGSGKALATGVGLIGGAILGDHIEMQGRPGFSRTVQRCEQQSSYENRVVAYDVVYELYGQKYSTQMGEEPGRTIPVQLTIAPLVSAPITSQVHSQVFAPRDHVSRAGYSTAVVATEVVEVRNRWPRARWHERHHGMVHRPGWD